MKKYNKIMVAVAVSLLCGVAHAETTYLYNIDKEVTRNVTLVDSDGNKENGDEDNGGTPSVNNDFGFSKIECGAYHCYALKNNTITASKDIKSIVKNGIVTLTGVVDWYYQKSSAFNSINKLFGIKSIINNKEVKPLIVIQPSTVKSQIT